MVADLLVNAGLFIIFLVVLIGPFRVPVIEHNLEIFLFACGAAALTISSFAQIPGEVTGWHWEIVEEAVTAPLRITDIFGIPIGIVQIVLLVGLIIYIWHMPIQRGIGKMVGMFSLSAMTFILVVALGLLSSVISAIIAAIILVEVLCALPLPRKSQIELTVIACFAIGLGAALTPLGEPLSTIAVSKLSGPPFFAGFDFLFQMLGMYVIPGIIAFGFIGVALMRRVDSAALSGECEVYRETLREVIIRAAKVYVFIAALVFLGEGFKPVIIQYIVNVPSEALYWVNMASAILDNATLTAAEIGPRFTELQIRSALMGLLISGGMLIPGNIPNIIAAGKLRITSKEWARVGFPIGLAAMIIYFVILFVPAYLGLA
jgi:predicted cation transporter